MLALYIILTIFSIIILLMGIAAINAVRMRKDFPDGKEFDMESDGIDPDRHAKSLSEIIKVPTVSRYGNKDMTNIYRLHNKLEQLYPNIHSKLEKIDIDGALLFKWKGENADDKPILLMSHMDVVEATGGWKYEPFSGTIADGKIWGRGAVDTKGSLCAILEAVEHLIEDGVTPHCDVYIASSNNEEITGDGAIKTVEYLYEKGITLDLVMDEGGAVMSSVAGGMSGSSAMVGIFEKGRANIKFTAHSPGGHASTPFKNNPFERLSKFMHTIENKRIFKKKLTDPVRHMYKAMTPYMSFRYRFVLGNLWLFGPILPYFMGKLGGQANALVSTTCVFTMAKGSNGANVIPQQASVTANMRFMIHQGLKESYEKVARLAAKLDIDMEMITGFDYSKVANMKTYAYKYVERSIANCFGDIPIIPYVMMAGTDSRHYTKICDCVLRFVPLMMTNEQLASAHAINENLSIESLERAVIFYKDFIKNYKRDNLQKELK